MFVDVGANIGYFSVIAGLLVGPGGRVFSFEPNGAARARLQRHLELNALTDRVVVSDAALGARDEEAVDFYLSCSVGNDGCSSLIPAPTLLASGTLRTDVRIAVPLRTFDSVAARSAIPRVDLVKIDVEGAEHGVLSGMARMLSTAPPRRIVCETPWGSDAHRLLVDRGYRVSVADEVIGGTPNLLFEWGAS